MKSLDVESQAETLRHSGASSLTRNDEIPSTKWKPTKEIWFIMGSNVLVLFMVSLDSTILSASLPTVAGALNANSVQAFWIVSSYLLASAIVQPIMAAMADIFGRRPAFFASIALFTVGNIICCTADTIGAMLAGRTIKGLGGGGIFSVNLIIMSDILPLRVRSKYLGLITLACSVGVNLGPVLGALLIRSTWRWLFYVNFPFCALGLVLSPFLLQYVQAETTTYDKISRVDWVGSALFMLGSTAFLIGVSWGGNMYRWTAVATLVPLIGGGAVVIATLLYERFVASTPFLRLSLFGNRTSVAVYLCTMLQNLTLFSELYFLTLFLLTVMGYAPLRAAAFITIFGATVIPCSGITGLFITKIGSYRPSVVVGWILNTAGLGTLIVLDPNINVLPLIFILLFAGIGQGVLFISHQTATQAACKTEDIPYATAMFSFMRSLGFCLGISLGGTMFQNLLRHKLMEHGLPTDIASHAEGYAPTLRAMPLSPMKLGIIDSYAWGFDILFAIMTAISGFGLLLSFFVKSYSLDRALETKHILKSTTTLPRSAHGESIPPLPPMPILPAKLRPGTGASLKH